MYMLFEISMHTVKHLKTVKYNTTFLSVRLKGEFYVAVSNLSGHKSFGQHRVYNGPVPLTSVLLVTLEVQSRFN